MSAVSIGSEALGFHCWSMLICDQHLLKIWSAMVGVARFWSKYDFKFCRYCIDATSVLGVYATIVKLGRPSFFKNQMSFKVVWQDITTCLNTLTEEGATAEADEDDAEEEEGSGPKDCSNHSCIMACVERGSSNAGLHWSDFHADWFSTRKTYDQRCAISLVNVDGKVNT